MPEKKNDAALTAKVRVLSNRGLHVTNSSLLVQLLASFKSSVELEYQGRNVDAKSILGLLTLGALPGAVMKVTVVGEDASETMAAVKSFFSKVME